MNECTGILSLQAAAMTASNAADYGAWDTLTASDGADAMGDALRLTEATADTLQRVHEAIARRVETSPTDNSTDVEARLRQVRDQIDQATIVLRDACQPITQAQRTLHLLTAEVSAPPHPAERSTTP